MSHFSGVMMASTGEGLVCWCVGERPWKWESKQVSPGRVSRMKYTHSGGLLYSAQGMCFSLVMIKAKFIVNSSV